jgi:integrase
MLRGDLETAGIPYADEAGRVLDFHSTRHTFISRLAEGGVHPKMAQTLARHSSITLTMDFYTHLSIHDQTAALEKLPPLPLIGKLAATRETGVA